MKRITGHLTEKNKKWYAVINLYDTDGKRKEKWQGLNLDANKGNTPGSTFGKQGCYQFFDHRKARKAPNGRRCRPM